MDPRIQQESYIRWAGRTRAPAWRHQRRRTFWRIFWFLLWIVAAAILYAWKAGAAERSELQAAQLPSVSHPEVPNGRPGLEVVDELDAGTVQSVLFGRDQRLGRGRVGVRQLGGGVAFTCPPSPSDPPWRAWTCYILAGMDELSDEEMGFTKAKR